MIKFLLAGGSAKVRDVLAVYAALSIRSLQCL